MSYPLDYNFLAQPGVTAALEQVDNQWWFGRHENQIWLPSTMSGAARDAGNTPDTTLLRSGLILGQVASSLEWKEWDPSLTAENRDGSEFAKGILGVALPTQRAGANVDRYLGYISIGGTVMSDRLIIGVSGEADEGIGSSAYLQLALAQLSKRFIFDKNLWTPPVDIWQPERIPTAAEIIAQAVTLTAADQGRLISNSGAGGTAVTFTLPQPVLGYRFYFRQADAGDLVIDTAGAAKIENTDNTTPSADSVTLGEVNSFYSVLGILAGASGKYLETNALGTLGYL